MAVLGSEKQSQTKPICRPSAGNPKHEALNPKRVERGYLKKQSQFATLTSKGAELAPPNAHIKGKQRVSEKSYRKVVKLCSG